MIAFDCMGHHKFALSVPIRRIKFDRPSMQDDCEFEPEGGAQLTGLDDILASNALSMGNSWTSSTCRTVNAPYEDSEYENIERCKGQRLAPKDRRTRVNTGHLSCLTVIADSSSEAGRHDDHQAQKTMEGRRHLAASTPTSQARMVRTKSQIRQVDHNGNLHGILHWLRRDHKLEATQS